MRPNTSTIWMVAQREFTDQFRDWRIVVPMFVLVTLFPFIADDTTRQAVNFMNRFGGDLILDRLVPFAILVIGFFPLSFTLLVALESFVGEKERGTIETILASPISRTALASGKFLAVLTTALCTAFLSLFSLGISSRLSGSGEMAQELPFALALNGHTVAAMLLMILPVAVLFAGALLAIALMAKSYREAQSYIQPLMIVVILPAVAAMLPGVDLNPKLALVPILNVSLVSKELVAGIYNWKLIGEIFLSSCLYAAIALFVAIRAFQRESVLFRT